MVCRVRMLLPTRLPLQASYMREHVDATAVGLILPRSETSFSFQGFPLRNVACNRSRLHRAEVFKKRRVPVWHPEDLRASRRLPGSGNVKFEETSSGDVAAKTVQAVSERWVCGAGSGRWGYLSI